jgi:26S proteasome regulatory subunit N10
LKHRQNKNQHQRIIFFVGSPIETDSEELVRLAKRLKKNNIAVDIINFGEEEQNTEKLEAFISAVNNNNSHLITIPPGPHILSDILLSSAVITGEEGESGAGSGGAPGANFGAFGGIDPNMDPELAMAIRISMEEERARQEAARKKEEGETGGSSSTAVPTTPGKILNLFIKTCSAPTVASTPNAPSHNVDMGEMDDDDLLQQAIAMSMQPEQQNQNQPQATPLSSKTTQKPSDSEMKDVDEEDDMALALKMSMQEGQQVRNSRIQFLNLLGH